MAILNFFNTLAGYDWMIVVCLSVGVTWWCITIWNKIKNCNNGTNDLKSIVEKNGEKLENLTSKVDQFIGMFQGNNGEFMKTKSPMKLTKIGEKLIETVDGKKIIAAHKDKLKLAEDLNAYQIQEACADFAM